MMNLFKRIKFKVRRIWSGITTGEYKRIAYLTPRRVVLITMRSEGKDNVLPVDWHMPLSFTPKLYAVSLEEKNHSAKMITESGEFAVNFMPYEMEEQVRQCGRISGADNDKFAVTGLGKIEAKKINAPLVKGSLGFIECRLKDKIKTGDHILFIGEVVNEKQPEEKLQLYHVSTDQT